jgi:uncharacterized iron-regulated membrane protein
MKGFLFKRWFWVRVHRYAGLYMAAFLTVAALTGAVLAWDHQVFAWLNPDLARVPIRTEPPLDVLTLRERALARAPGTRINFVIHNQEPGAVAMMLTEPAAPPSDASKAPDYGMIYLNPYTGEEIARDKAEAWPVTRRNFIRFVFDVHAALSLGGIGGRLMGIAALIWTVDCFVGLGLTFPRPVPEPVAGGAGAPARNWWIRWAPSWRFVVRGRAYRITFNAHRAAGLWTWGFLLVFAVSSVAFNLPEVYQPVSKGLLGAHDAQDDIPDLQAPVMDAAMDWKQAFATGARIASEQALKAGVTLHPARGELYFSYNPMKGVFAYQAHGDADVGSHAPAITVFFDHKTGEFRGANFASGKNAGVTFNNLITAIHGATFWGWVGQFIVFVVALVIIGLSVSGVWLWWRRNFAN